MNYAEEQAGEIEALMSIYEGDLEGSFLKDFRRKMVNFKFKFVTFQKWLFLKCVLFKIVHLLID
jgi:hypothetical protein